MLFKRLFTICTCFGGILYLKSNTEYSNVKLYKVLVDMDMEQGAFLVVLNILMMSTCIQSSRVLMIVVMY